jgi:4-oxalocrotonate tautomerase
MDRHALALLPSPEMSLAITTDGGSVSRVEGADQGVQWALKDFWEPGGTMPFVSIRLIEGRSHERKDEISKRVADAISDVLQLPKEDVWIVFEDIRAEDWYVGSTTIAELRKKTQK